MKKVLIASALSAAFASPAVFAQASNFAGFYGQVGIGYEYNTVNSTGPNYLQRETGQDSNRFNATEGAGGKSFGNSVGIGFGLALTDRILLQIGAEYQPLGGDTRTFGTNFTINGSPDGGFPGNMYTIKNRYGIFLSPGYAIDDNKLAYLKVGYTGQTVNARLTRDPSLVVNTSKDVSGIMVGLGYRQLLSSNVYFFAEANYLDYGKAEFTILNLGRTGTYTSSPKSSNFNALVGIGARF